MRIANGIDSYLVKKLEILLPFKRCHGREKYEPTIIKLTQREKLPTRLHSSVKAVYVYVYNTNAESLEI